MSFETLLPKRSNKYQEEFAIYHWGFKHLIIHIIPGLLNRVRAKHTYENRNYAPSNFSTYPVPFKKWPWFQMKIDGWRWNDLFSWYDISAAAHPATSLYVYLVRHTSNTRLFINMELSFINIWYFHGFEQLPYFRPTARPRNQSAAFMCARIKVAFTTIETLLQCDGLLNVSHIINHIFVFSSATFTKKRWSKSAHLFRWLIHLIGNEKARKLKEALKSRM